MLTNKTWEDRICFFLSNAFPLLQHLRIIYIFIYLHNNYVFRNKKHYLRRDSYLFLRDPLEKNVVFLELFSKLVASLTCKKKDAKTVLVRTVNSTDAIPSSNQVLSIIKTWNRPSHSVCQQVGHVQRSTLCVRCVFYRCRYTIGGLALPHQSSPAIFVACRQLSQMWAQLWAQFVRSWQMSLNYKSFVHHRLSISHQFRTG